MASKKIEIERREECLDAVKTATSSTISPEIDMSRPKDRTLLPFRPDVDYAVVLYAHYRHRIRATSAKMMVIGCTKRYICSTCTHEPCTCTPKQLPTKYATQYSQKFSHTTGLPSYITPMHFWVPIAADAGNQTDVYRGKIFDSLASAYFVNMKAHDARYERYRENAHSDAHKTDATDAAIADAKFAIPQQVRAVLEERRDDVEKMASSFRESGRTEYDDTMLAGTPQLPNQQFVVIAIMPDLRQEVFRAADEEPAQDPEPAFMILTPASTLQEAQDYISYVAVKDERLKQFYLYVQKTCEWFDVLKITASNSSDKFMYRYPLMGEIMHGAKDCNDHITQQMDKLKPPSAIANAKITNMSDDEYAAYCTDHHIAFHRDPTTGHVILDQIERMTPDQLSSIKK